MLKTVIIDISKFNEDDSFEAFAANTSFEIERGIDPMRSARELFLITDSRKTADLAGLKGIGFAAYLSDEKFTNEKVINEFPDSLYLITSISELTDETIIRMHQRANDIPWTILETKHAAVREITLSDIDDLYDIYSDEETVRYIERLYENKADEIEFTKNYINNQYRYFEYGLWAVTSKPDGRLIGRAGIFNREGFGLPELGFMFERPVWGTGIAFEVCDAILKYSREEFGFDRFNAFTKHENVRGSHFLRRLGFEYKNAEIINNESLDMYVLG